MKPSLVMLPRGKLFALGTCLVLCSSGAAGLQAANQLIIGQGTGTPSTFGLVPVSLRTDLPAVAVQFDVQFDSGQLFAGTPVIGALDPNHRLVASQLTNGVL